MSERTKGNWKIDKIATAGGAPIIVSDKCWLGGKRQIAKVLYHSGSEDPEVYPNAKFICLAANYHDRLVEALKFFMEHSGDRLDDYKYDEFEELLLNIEQELK
jgi:hypothetical protein